MHLQLVFLQKYVVRPPLPWLDAMPFYCPIVSNFALVICLTENCLFYGLRFGPTCCRPRYKKKPWKELSHAQEITTLFTHSTQVKSPFNSQGVHQFDLEIRYQQSKSFNWQVGRKSQLCSDKTIFGCHYFHLMKTASILFTSQTIPTIDIRNRHCEFLGKKCSMIYDDPSFRFKCTFYFCNEENVFLSLLNVLS